MTGEREPRRVVVEPVVRWPRDVVTGESYLVEVDLRLPSAAPEAVLFVRLDGAPYVAVQSVDPPQVTLGRSGGTPVRFVITPRGPAGPRSLMLTICSTNGYPVRTDQLPLNVTTPAPAAAVADPPRNLYAPHLSAGPARSGGRRVLLAEDEALIRLDLAEMLIEEGYDVVGEAGDGETAVRLAEELRPDVIILDIKMPIMDGLAAAEKIAGRRIAPVVVLTAFSQRDLVERARAAGAMAYLVKPFQKSDLVPAMEIAVSRYAELSALESEVSALTDRLETRKVVERAKAQLMAMYGMNEPQAFKWIQRTAMDNRMTMREVADRVMAELHGIADL